MTAFLLRFQETQATCGSPNGGTGMTKTQVAREQSDYGCMMDAQAALPRCAVGTKTKVNKEQGGVDNMSSLRTFPISTPGR
jgi:hypothetical protein